MNQISMFSDDVATGSGSGDPLERHYTDSHLAAFCLSLLPWEGIRAVLEPHAGGGAFLRHLMTMDLMWFAYDIDPQCWAIQQGHATLMDFLKVPVGRLDRVVGNPPFDQAEEHVKHGLELADEVAFLMPLDRLESATRLPFWRDYPPVKIWVFAERVWPGSRCIAWYWWTADHLAIPKAERPDTRIEVVSWRHSNQEQA